MLQHSKTKLFSLKFPLNLHSLIDSWQQLYHYDCKKFFSNLNWKYCFKNLFYLHHDKVNDIKTEVYAFILA